MSRNANEDGSHPVDRHVGRRVCEKRLSLGYNQSDLARALGLTFQQIQKYEKGANRVSASKLWDMARFFEVDINYFFAGLSDADGLDVVDVEPAAPATRQTVEIFRLAPQLSTRQQKLALKPISALAGESSKVT